jgi:hypothetical protein
MVMDNNNGFGSLFLGRFFGDFLSQETKKLVEKNIPRFIRYKHGYGFLSPISQCFGVAHAARRALKTMGGGEENFFFLTVNLRSFYSVSEKANRYQLESGSLI